MAKKDINEVLMKAIKSHTVKWGEKYFEVKEKQTAKAKKLSKLLGDLTHGKADKALLAKILSEVSGEDVVLEAEEDVEFHPITALVLTKLNTTDAKHSYETEKVLLAIGDGSAISPEGTVGGMIPKKRSIMRPATVEEIEKITTKQLEKLKEEVNILVTDPD